MSKTIEEILAPKPEARPRIYAYSIADPAHAGLLKVGQTTRDVKQRVAEQLQTANIKNYTIVLDDVAECDDGTIFTDHAVRAALAKLAYRRMADPLAAAGDHHDLSGKVIHFVSLLAFLHQRSSLARHSGFRRCDGIEFP